MKGRRGLSKGKSQRAGANPRGERRPAGDSRVRGIDRPRGESFAAYTYPPRELLERGLAALGFPPGPEPIPFGGLSVACRGADGMVPLVERYLSELELFNSAFDLVGEDTGPGSPGARSELVVRHVLDSLAPWRALFEGVAAAHGRDASGEEPLRFSDVGSGAGFPGIPLAIAFPEIEFVLLERMAKRCAFLENCVAILGLRNARVLNAEAERGPSSQFDAVCFRAFRPLDRAMARTLLALARPAGVLAAWKGRSERIDEEMGEITDAIGAWSATAVSVPFLPEGERHLVLVSR